MALIKPIHWRFWFLMHRGGGGGRGVLRPINEVGYLRIKKAAMTIFIWV